jgi:hypothetical protein
MSSRQTNTQPQNVTQAHSEARLRRLLAEDGRAARRRARYADTLVGAPLVAPPGPRSRVKHIKTGACHE